MNPIKSMDNLIIFSQNMHFSAQEKFIAAIGVFDGVHLGHRKIISAARTLAEKCRAKVLALSFTPHPRALLTPGHDPELLISEKERTALLLAAGADICGFINFTPRIAALPPESFLEELRDHAGINICGITVGSNWKFGCKGSGSRTILEKFCAANSWLLDAVPELEMNGITVSSTAIRSAVAAGNLTAASEMLGRKAAISGTVEHGFQIAGSELNAPTANLLPESGVLPPDGVYSGETELDGATYPAAINIGLAPTFGNQQRRIEVHLLDFSGSLYGRTLKVELHRFLRPERRFDSVEELKNQIAADIAAIRSDFRK